MPRRLRGSALRGSGLALALTVVLAATGACTSAPESGGRQTSVAPSTTSTTSTSATPSSAVTDPTGPGSPSNTVRPSTVAPTTVAPTTVTPTTVAPTTARPTPTYRTILRPGDAGHQVRELQARLRQIGWFDADVTDYYGARTTAAVEGFQAKRGYPVTGIVDTRTWDRLLAMTRPPTRDELDNVRPTPAPTRLTWDVDQRCLTGRVMCISKETRMLTWVIDGVPQYQFDVRFGSDELPTREGTFFVYKKMEYVVSNLYHTPMPYSMFFSGGQAVHYSSNFARLGYSGASHGCINVRDWNGIQRLYDDSRIGDKVVVHW